MKKNILAKAAFLCSVVMLMAVSCPGPQPPVPPTPPEQSEALKNFLQQSAPGLYINGAMIVVYDEENCQQAWEGNNCYRIVRDDQTAYMHSVVTYDSPSSIFRITYKQSDGNETMLTVRLESVLVKEDLTWWWNESISTGAITSGL
ncbi:MAG: hypothetical protein HUJ90_01785 [Bacteroidales bacterium]|nr:hypothetical protein [Bacteroidales bacterium]